MSILTRGPIFGVHLTSLYGGPFTSEDLVVRFPNIQQNPWAGNREGFVNTVRQQNNPRFLGLVYEWLTNETDLIIANRLTLVISELTKQDFWPRDLERITEWVSAHSAEYPAWPNETYFEAMDHFSRLNYSESALLFEQVVDIDPEAGISRALAIACNLELGDTNKATRLAKGFKDPNFRWAKWVTAKAELESGAISNATFIAANLTTNFPSMRMLPDRGSHIWRKLDWNLFEQLTASNGVSTSFDDH